MSKVKASDKQLLQRQLAQVEQAMADLAEDARIIRARIHGYEPGVTHQREEGHHIRRIISYKKVVQDDPRYGDEWIEEAKNSKLAKRVEVTTHHWARIVIPDKKPRKKRAL